MVLVDRQARDRLLRDIRSRIALYLDHGDPAGVLYEGAWGDTVSLIRATGMGTGGIECELDAVDAEAVGVLAKLYATRALARSGDERALDQSNAAGLFRLLSDVEPQSLPGDIVDDARAVWTFWANGSMDLWNRDGDREHLDRVIHYLGRVVSTTRLDDPDFGRSVVDLSGALANRFKSGGDVDDLHSGETLLRWALSHVPQKGEHRTNCLSNLGAILQEKYRCDTVPAYLWESISVLREAIATEGRDDHHRIESLNNLSTALVLAFEHAGDQGYLDEAIALLRQVIVQCPDSDASRPMYLANLVSTLGKASAGVPGFWATLSDPSDLDAAVDGWRRSVAETSAKHEDYYAYVGTLAIVLVRRFEYSGLDTDLDEALNVLRDGLLVIPRDHPSNVHLLVTFGAASCRSFERSSNSDDLSSAIEALRNASLLIDPSEPLYFACLGNLGTALFQRAKWGGETADLDAAVELLAQASEGFEVGSANRTASQFTLGAALRRRFERTGTATDLMQAIAVLRESLKGDARERATGLNNLSDALLTRFEATGEVDSLTEAIAVGRQSILVNSTNDNSRAMCLNTLAAALRRRFAHLGDVSDLHESVDLQREVVRISGTSAQHAMYLSNLSAALLSRFDQIGDSYDLDEAVSTARDAVTRNQSGAPNTTGTLQILAAALYVRHQRLGDRSDIDAAIDVLRRSVKATTPTDADYPGHLQLLGTALLGRYRASHSIEDLTSSLEALRLSTTLVRADSPSYGACLGNLSTASHAWFEHTGDLADLSTAIDLARRVLLVTPGGHPDMAAWTANLANKLWSRFRQNTGDQDLSEALGHWRTAVDTETGTISARLRAATSWGQATLSMALRLPAGHRRTALFGAALEGFSAAVELVPLSVSRALDRETREQRATEWTGLASRAAACAIELGQWERAVELLEHGRSVLWTQLLEARGDFTQLHQIHPELATELERLRTELDEWPEVRSPLPEPQHAATVLADRRKALADRWATLIRQVRGLPEFQYFLRSRGWEELRTAAAGGPVVVVNVSSVRCDALIVRNEGVDLVPLPDLSWDLARDLTNQYLTALQIFAQGKQSQFDRVILEQAISATLMELWKLVCLPVLTALGYTEIPRPDANWPRLWWCATGPLTLVPLHAGGDHHAAPSQGRTVMDRVISSYTPSLHALLKARAAAEGPARTKQMLAVTLPNTPGQLPLPSVKVERELLSDLFGTQLTLLNGPDATREAVLSELGNHPSVHFACHGSQSLTHPSSSHLILHDADLSIVDIASRQGTGLELAYLSACVTAVGGVQLIDEAMSLATAFQMAGYRQVISTLWSIGDNSAAEVAAHVYRTFLASNGASPRSAAAALHSAVRALRDIDRQEGRCVPSRWAPFIHLGH
ncbi:CHAT domain-containing protein [Longispora fulva]|uniref:Tetratricopeptide (TPR) repeat protein n=1 Tax=Longispora fulva TaxID=619741 RepID=A0A8J7G6D8_9ACTN|nr:CHAT domain-containing protein [Longispora fulva]MBG6134523.1 tetratricopeptide (TPR) repeat protein [Longispora fulva]